MSDFIEAGIQFQFYDPHCIEVASSYDPRFRRNEKHFAKQAASVTRMRELLGIEKPDWFIEAEDEARDFVGSHALQNDFAITLLPEKDWKDAVSNDSTKAISYSTTGDIFVNERLITQTHEQAGLPQVGGTLVHELIHSTATIDTVTIRKRSDESYTTSYRSGFGITRGRQRFGAFYEEALATTMDGWFRRTRDNPLAPPVDTNMSPSKTLPTHFQNVTAKVSGPDGHALELIAWGLEKRSIMPASTFIGLALASRRKVTQALALRGFAVAVDCLQPGLYRRLRSVTYGADAWNQARDDVYGIVTS
jgi:hypothetical protein